MLLIIFACVLISIITDTISLKVSVKTKHGTILGNTEATVFERKTYYAFYGVPYARAPVGKLRFKNPQAIKKFKVPFDAITEYHGACAQAHIVHKHAVYGHEDCLYLNIYTPFLPGFEKQNKRAVIVWIHGYAFTSSFSHVYGPDFLVENDIVFISLTHRIGVFGFLKLNATDGNANMGLKDIGEGLKWINKNVEFFGGDRNKITLMGSGSASTSISLLIMTKYNRLFSQMILHSGSIFSPSIFQGNVREEKIKLKNELKKLGLKNIQKAPSTDLIAASQKIYKHKDFLNFQRPVIPFTPHTETQTNYSLLPNTVEDIYKKITRVNANKPILIGFASQEGMSELIPFIYDTRYIKMFEKNFPYMVPFGDGCKHQYSSRKYAQVANKIKRYYFKKGITENSIDELLGLTVDLHKYPIYKYIESQIDLKNENIYVFKFDYVGKFNMIKATSLAEGKFKIKGSAQGDELCYLLKCEPAWKEYVKIRNDLNNPDRKFIKSISEMWANFAKFADPTPYNHSARWFPMTSINNNIYLIGKRYKYINNDSEKRMYNFWNELYTQDYSPQNCNDINDEL